MTHARWITKVASRTTTSLGTGLLLLAIHTSLSAQQTDHSSDRSSQKESAQPSLTDGLLDLLDEPQPGNDPPAKTPLLTPADVGLEGEDLSEQSDDPLLAVRQSMLIAAGFLERGQTNADTQDLQADIVQRLDELISQFEQPQQPPQPSPPEPSSAEQSQPTESSGNSTQQSTSTTPSPTSTESPESQGDGKDRPGQTATPANAVEQLKDPVALQRSIWGQLPEQVRQQMQSQMVEQFLPSYQVQIEAYFKALLEQR